MSCRRSVRVPERVIFTGAAPGTPLESAFIGRLSSLASCLAISHVDVNVVRGDQLILPDVIADRLKRFSSAFPNASRQSLVALWVRWHVMRLLAAAVIPALVIDRRLPVRLDECSVIFSDENAYPLAIQITDTAAVFTTDDPFNRFDVLIWLHLDPFITELARHGRTSARLLWGNTAIQFDWFVQQIVLEMSEQGLSLNCDARALFEVRLWPGGRPNPLFEPWRVMPAGYDGPRRRKVCCLDYKLEPGRKLCVDCPIGIKTDRPDMAD